MGRYPYLAEGDTLEKRNTIRSYLFKNGYRIAEVTTADRLNGVCQEAAAK